MNKLFIIKYIVTLILAVRPSYLKNKQIYIYMCNCFEQFSILYKWLGAHNLLVMPTGMLVTIRGTLVESTPSVVSSFELDYVSFLFEVKKTLGFHCFIKKGKKTTTNKDP